MMTAAQAVRDALHALLVKVRDGGRDAQQAGQYDAACDDILGATDRLFNSMLERWSSRPRSWLRYKICLYLRTGAY